MNCAVCSKGIEPGELTLAATMTNTVMKKDVVVCIPCVIRIRKKPTSIWDTVPFALWKLSQLWEKFEQWVTQKIVGIS